MSITYNAVEIPLQPQPQRLSVTLGGTSYNLRTAWNEFAACWMLDINNQNNNALVDGIALVPGVDLLEQYGYLAIGGTGGRLIVFSQTDPAHVPQYDDLGVGSHLIFLTPVAS